MRGQRGQEALGAVVEVSEKDAPRQADREADHWVGSDVARKGEDGRHRNDRGRRANGSHQPPLDDSPEENLFTPGDDQPRQREESEVPGIIRVHQARVVETQHATDHHRPQHRP